MRAKYNNVHDIPIEDILDYDFLFDSFDRANNVAYYSMTDLEHTIGISIICKEPTFYSLHKLHDIITFENIAYMEITFYNDISIDVSEIVKEYIYLPNSKTVTLNLKDIWT